VTAGKGQIIQATDFNTIRDKFYNVFGKGSGSVGYGQLVTAAAATTNTLMSANIWQKLRNDMVKARQHQLGTVVGRSSATDGRNLVVISKGQLITEAIRNQYNLFADTVIADKYKAHPGQLARAVIINENRTKPWNGTVVQSITITASSAGDGRYNNFRYLFNAGGKIELNVSRSGGSNSAKNHFWTDLLSKVGTITMNYDTTTRSGSSGTVYPTGFYELTTSNKLLYTIPGSGIYASNYFNVYARLVNNSSIVFDLVFADRATEYPVDQNINGVLNTKATYYKPYGSNVNVYGVTASAKGLQTGTASTSYVIMPTVDVVSEGNTSTITLVSNDPTPRTLYWTTVGNVQADDFTDNNLVGTITLDSNGRGSMSRTILMDKMTELSTEYYVIQFRAGSYSGPIVAYTKNIVIEDTSKYTFSVSGTSVNEGGTITYQLNSSASAEGRVYYVTLSGSIENEDIVGGAFSTRTITMHNNVAAGSITVSTDWVKWESEQFVIQVREGSKTGPILAASPKITIVEKTPVVSMWLSLYLDTRKNTTLTSGSQWTVPSGLTNSKLYATIYGAGGGGGGYHGGCNYTDKHPGGDGGKGEIRTATLTVSPGSKLNYYIGRGGTGGAMTTNGLDGDSSWFYQNSSSYKALGGGGGKYGGFDPSSVPTSTGKTNNDTAVQFKDTTATGLEGADGLSRSTNGKAGGVGGKNRDTDPTGNNGSNGAIELAWDEHSQSSYLTSNSQAVYNIKTTNMVDGTKLYVTIRGQVNTSIITNGITQVVTVTNNAASGYFNIGDLGNSGDKSAWITAQVTSFSGLEVARTPNFTIIGHGNVSFINPGTYPFVALKSKCLIQYPNGSGTITSKYVNLTVGKRYVITVGTPGNKAYISEALQIPEINKEVFIFSGNLDIYDYFTFPIHSATGQWFTSQGGQAVHRANAAAHGIDLVESNEGNHGDLYSSIQINPFKTEVMNYGPAVDSYHTLMAGRNATFHLDTKPAQSNGYTLRCSADDAPGRSEGYFYYKINVKMSPFILISW